MIAATPTLSPSVHTCFLLVNLYHFVIVKTVIWLLE